MPVATPRIIVALDFANLPQALACADLLDPRLCRVKVGKELFTRAGPAVIKALHEREFSVFLDLKYHDIPNTVAKAVHAACEQGVWLVNVHALGGSRMMRAALASVQQAHAATKIIGVTVLTSFDAAQLAEVGLSGTIADNVRRLAQLTQQAGLHGVVCSAHEAQQIKQWCGADFLTVTPGIRPQGSQANDQERIMTPGQAVQNGADYLVIGRPITEAADPLIALQQCQQDITNCTK